MRKLHLSKEVLSELSDAELGAIAGATATATELTAQFCPTDPCITEPVTQLKCLLSLGPHPCIS